MRQNVGGVLLKLVVLLLLGVLLPLRAASFHSGGAFQVVVETSSGLVGGAQTALGFQFKSIPFALPPVGDLRFAPPEPTADWEGVLNATKVPYACPQPSLSNGPWDEDCLYLSLYVPLSFETDQRPKRDVVVFFHGGSFRGGGQVNYIGDFLANHTNTVVVVPQYRLGALGLLGHDVFQEESGTYGNYNLMDQRMSLLWVRANIRHFGGNPKRVTISGQSAGSISVAIHTVSPMSFGLYHRAFGHSGVGYSGKLLAPRIWITDTMQKLVDGLQCGSGTATRCNESSGCSAALRECLRSAPVANIMAVQQSLSELAKPRPAVDGIVIPDQPIELVKRGQFNRVPTVSGLLANESTVLIQKSYPLAANKTHFDAYVTSMFGASAIPTFEGLYPVGTSNNGGYPTYYAAMAKIDTDWYYTCPTLNWLDAQALHGNKKAHFYYWTYQATWFPSAYGANHNEDVLYLTQQGCLLNTPTAYCSTFTPETTPSEMPLVRLLQSVWSALASTGKPSEVVAGWDAYTPKNGRPYLRIESPTSNHISSEPIQTAQCAYINTFITT